MGPRLDGRGDGDVDVLVGSGKYVLQWGRGLMAAVTCSTRRRRGSSTARRLQWGRGLMAAVT